MYTEVDVEQETYMRIELMEENMVSPEDALNTASCKRSQNSKTFKQFLLVNLRKTSPMWQGIKLQI